MGVLDKLFRRGNSAIDLSNATKAELAAISRYPFDTKEREWIEYRIGVPIHKFEDYNSYLEAGSKKCWATFRACRIISSVVLSAKFRMGEKTAEERDAGFLVSPNPYDSWPELLEMWAFHMELVGNAYWLKDQIDMKGRPLHLYPLMPQHMRVVPDKENKISSYIYTVNGNEVRYTPEEIIHFRSVHPSDSIMGMGSIEPSESIYNEFINKSFLGEKFIENGAQLSGVMTRETDIADEAQWAKLRKKFNVEYAGKKNAGKVAFLNGKWNYHRLGMTMAEMQSIEKEKWNVEQIFLNHGIPLSIVGIDGAANYATARQDEVNFRKYKIVPLLDMLVGKINSDGFLGTGDQISYEMSGLIDVEQIVKEYKPLVELGAMTANELRELCNLPLIDNPLLDQFLVDTTRVPLELAGVSDPSTEVIESVVGADDSYEEEA